MRQPKSPTKPLIPMLSVLALAGVAQAETSQAEARSESAEKPALSKPARSEDALSKEQLSQQLWDWYGEASDLHDAGKLSEAWALYQRVWRHRKTYDVATSLGGVCFQRGEYALAAHYFRIALDEMVPTASPKFVKEVEEAYDKARSESTLLRVVVAPFAGKTLPVTITDESGNVVLESPYYLEVGERELEAKSPGHVPVSLRVLAKPGATVEWKVDFDAGERQEVIGIQRATTTVRHPWIVLPIGGLVTAGLGYGAWHNAARGVDAYDSTVNLGLSPGACNESSPNTGETNTNCERAVTLRQQARDAQTRAFLFGGSAVLTAVATGVVYWLWKTEVPVSVAFDPTQHTGELRWMYEF